MTLHMNPSGNIELQQTVRELEERVTTLEATLYAVPEAAPVNAPEVSKTEWTPAAPKQ